MKNFFVIFLLCAIASKSGAQLSLSIERKVASANCITGYLSVNGKPLFYTLELPYIDNLSYLSSIPKGKYNAKIRTDGKLGWRIELIDVPNRKNIQIHIGNYTSQIVGCTLIGKNVIVDSCKVEKSKDAMKELENELVRFKKDLCLDCNSSSLYDIVVEYK